MTINPIQSGASLRCPSRASSQSLPALFCPALPCPAALPYLAPGLTPRSVTHAPAHLTLGEWESFPDSPAN